MDPQISFHNDGTPYRLRGKREISKWIIRCIEEEGFRAGEINYIFCSGENHLEINRRYLGHNYRTDVITFDYTDYAARIVSGDIFIDPQTIRDNALLYGETARREMLRVLVHGMLHLCGYKDKTDPEAKLMRSKENECLSMLK